MKSPLKPYHLFLTSAYACYLISIVLGPLFVLNSADESIFYGHYYARIVVSGLFVSYVSAKSTIYLIDLIYNKGTFIDRY